MFSLRKGTEVRVHSAGHPSYLWGDTHIVILSMYLFYKRDKQPDLGGNLSHAILLLLPVTSSAIFLI